MRGGAGKGGGSKGCRGAEHGRTCTKDHTGAAALRAALESAMQLGRGDEVTRQADMANPTKCRDSLQEQDVGLRGQTPVLPKYSMPKCNIWPQNWYENRIRSLADQGRARSRERICSVEQRF
jgi:hypothetical protein